MSTDNMDFVDQELKELYGKISEELTAEAATESMKILYRGMIRRLDRQLCIDPAKLNDGEQALWADGVRTMSAIVGLTRPRRHARRPSERLLILCLVDAFIEDFEQKRRVHKKGKEEKRKGQTAS
jgi:hypothetical protein